MGLVCLGNQEHHTSERQYRLALEHVWKGKHFVCVCFFKDRGKCSENAYAWKLHCQYRCLCICNSDESDFQNPYESILIITPKGHPLRDATFHSLWHATQDLQNYCIATIGQKNQLRTRRRALQPP